MYIRTVIATQQENDESSSQSAESELSSSQELNQELNTDGELISRVMCSINDRIVRFIKAEGRHFEDKIKKSK